MIKRIIMILLIAASSSAFAADILQINVSVFLRSNGEYVTYSNALIKGNYHRYIDRMLNVHHYREMGVPYVRSSLNLSSNKNKYHSWVHMRVFMRDVQFYSRGIVKRGPLSTSAHFWLAPQGGALPNQHPFQILSGDSYIHIISGTPENGVFRVINQHRLMFHQSKVQMGVKSVLEKLATGSVRAFAN